jgi:hypothetical protein
MMNILEKLYKMLDESDWDIVQDDLINNAFKETNDELHKSGEEELFRQSETERISLISRTEYK